MANPFKKKDAQRKTRELSISNGCKKVFENIGIVFGIIVLFFSKVICDLLAQIHTV